MEPEDGSHATFPLAATAVPGADGDRRHVVQVALRVKDVSAGVDAFLARNRHAPPARLALLPANGPIQVDDGLCRAMAVQAYAAIEQAMRGRRFSSTHLFAAAPQAFMMMLGRAFKGMPQVHLHEWTGARYVASCVVPGAVL